MRVKQNIKPIILYIFLILIYSIAYVSGQEIKFEHITDNNGLPVSSITCIDQDDDGFIWMGSMEGLIKYNGYSFKIFRHKINDSLSLPGHLVIDVYCGSDQKIYSAIKASGLSILNPQTEQFTNLVPEKLNTYESITINKILPDSLGNLWLASDRGIYYFNTKNKSFTKLELTNPLVEIDSVNNFHEYYSAITFDHENHLLILGHKGSLLHYNLRTKEVKPHEYSSTLQESVFLFSSGELLFINKNNVWIGTENNGIFLYNLEKQKNERHLLPGIIVSNIYKIDNSIWVATDGKGVEIYNTKGDLLKQLTNNPYEPLSLSSDAVYCSFKTRDKTIIVGNYSTGLNIYSAGRHKFNYISNVGNPDFRLSNKAVLATMQISSSNILIGTDGGGINNLNLITNKVSQLTSDDVNIDKLVAKTFCRDGENSFYVGTYGKGLFYFDLKSETKANITPIKHDVAGRYRHVWSLAKVSDTALWIGYLNAGLCIYNPKTKEYRIHQEFYDKNVVSVINDGNYVWVSAEQKGIYLCNTKGDILQYYHNYNGGKNAVSSNYILDVYTDSKGRIWMGTSNGGINQLKDIEKGIFKKYNQHLALQYTSISNIEEDTTGTFWLTSNIGIIQFNPDSEIVKVYDKNDGIPGTNFSYQSSLNYNNKMLFFGSVDGLIVFQPKNIKVNNVEPQVAFTQLRINNQIIKPFAEVNGRIILKKPLEYTDTIQLHHTEDDFTIEFSALHFESPQKNKYEYKLEGFNNKWIACNPGEHAARYTNLKKGTFVLKVRAANPDNLWNYKPTELTIKVIPPFYQQNLFYWLLIVLLGFLIYGFIRWRTYRLMIEKDKLRKLVELKTEALNAKANKVIEQNDEIKAINDQLRAYNVTRDKIFSIIAHDLRNPLNAINSFSKMLNEDLEQFSHNEIKKYISVISQTSDKMNDLIINLLYWVNNQIGKIKVMPKDLKLETVFDEIQKISEANALQKGICIDFNHNNLSLYFDYDMLVTILRNLISNSIKFTPEKGTISVFAHAEKENTVLSISDSGLGMSAIQIKMLESNKTLNSTKGTGNESGTGLGLLICKEFTEKNNGVFVIESIPNQGTTIKIIAPSSVKIS